MLDGFEAQLDQTLGQVVERGEALIRDADERAHPRVAGVADQSIGVLAALIATQHRGVDQVSGGPTT